MKSDFNHAINVRDDDKIQNLLAEYGMEGYGVYWTIVELIQLNDGVLKFTSGEKFYSEWKRVCYLLHCNEDVFSAILIANKFDLFETGFDNIIYSNYITKKIHPDSWWILSK